MNYNILYYLHSGINVIGYENDFSFMVECIKILLNCDMFVLQYLKILLYGAGKEMRERLSNLLTSARALVSYLTEREEYFPSVQVVSSGVQLS